VGRDRAAMACFDEALSYTKERKMFGRPVASFQLTQAKLADMLTEITSAQLIALQLGRLKEAGKMRPQQVSLAKRKQRPDRARHRPDRARDARANGISDEYQTMRHMCNLESVDTYEGTYEIHTLVLGKDVTGIDAVS